MALQLLWQGKVVAAQPRMTGVGSCVVHVRCFHPILRQGRGGCFATDMITVEGLKVGYMYREKPDNDSDSGWRFMAGQESQEYMDNPDNHTIHDVNTIANYDPQIIPFLNEPMGSVFERDQGSGKFVRVQWEPGE